MKVACVCVMCHSVRLYEGSGFSSFIPLILHVPNVQTCRAAFMVARSCLRLQYSRRILWTRHVL